MRPDSLSLSPYAGYLFPLYFVAIWCCVCFVICILSGWHALARRFQSDAEPYGDTRTAGPFFYAVKMRFNTNYGNAIRLTASAGALYLSVLAVFRVGHPPLCIPWSEIKIRRTKIAWWRFVILTLGDEEQISMRISERMARNLGILERIPN